MSEPQAGGSAGSSAVICQQPPGQSRDDEPLITLNSEASPDDVQPPSTAG